MSAQGWFVDPYSRNEYRYWDGELWTEQVRSNGQTGTDPMPFAPPPEPPVDSSVDGPPVVDPLFTEQRLIFEEEGTATLRGNAFGHFAISTPDGRAIGEVEREGKRHERFYRLRNATGTHLATLNPQMSKVWHLVGANNEPIGEFTHVEKSFTFVDMMMPISVGGFQIAEVRSDDARGTRMSVTGLAGPLLSIERPKGIASDSMSTLDDYKVTRHRQVFGAIAWLTLMVPVALDDARYRRDRIRMRGR